MRDGAPPVSYPVGRTHRLGVWMAVLCLLGVATALWVLYSLRALENLSLIATILIASALLSGAGCWWFWRQQAPRLLRWDGARWQLEPDVGWSGDELSVQVRLDLQRMLLLRLEQSSPRRHLWLWAEQGRDAADWHLLRCALYSFSPSAAAALAPEPGERA